MKEYKLGILRCRCSNVSRLGKPFKMYSQFKPKKCKNCGKIYTVKALNWKDNDNA